MHKKFLRTSAILAVLSLSAHLLAVSPALSMEENVEELGPEWKKVRLLWGYRHLNKDDIHECSLKQHLFESAKEFSYHQNLDGEYTEDQIVNCNLTKPVLHWVKYKIPSESEVEKLQKLNGRTAVPPKFRARFLAFKEPGEWGKIEIVRRYGWPGEVDRYFIELNVKNAIVWAVPQRFETPIAQIYFLPGWE